MGVFSPVYFSSIVTDSLTFVKVDHETYNPGISWCSWYSLEEMWSVYTQCSTCPNWNRGLSLLSSAISFLYCTEFCEDGSGEHGSKTT